MAVESVTNIDDLVPANPAFDDPVSEGDDHIRNIKTALTNNFGSIGGNVTADQTDLNRCDVTTEGTANNSEVITVSAGGTINMNSKAMTGVDINSGAIDGTTIGAGAAAAVTGTTIKANTSIQAVGGAAITEFETTSTNSPTKVPTSSAMQTYADSVAGLISAGTPLEVNPVAGGSSSQAHGLGAVPVLMVGRLVCTAAGGDLGWAQNDEVSINNSTDSDSLNATRGLSIGCDGTNVYSAIDTTGIQICNKSTGAVANITFADWKLVVTPYTIST